MTRKAPLDIDADPHISSILGAGMSIPTLRIT